uniref:Cleavage and polyadenylation specificity factor n=1 Tax=Oryza sativa subsp. indica TaxID=39946 RepID=A0MLV3_ORYSI|nr:cleavage and polyadenylation specificity factor [Oryza sativa Indica Group]
MLTVVFLCVDSRHQHKFDCGIHLAYSGMAALPYFDEIDPSTIDLSLGPCRFSALLLGKDDVQGARVHDPLPQRPFIGYSFPIMSKCRFFVRTDTYVVNTSVGLYPL